jgi:S-adenosyl-L-methionine hydrolase (adenosine-forming)
LNPRIITLLTDFGSQDYFVGAMKGVILSINSNVSIVDITHEIPPQDVRAAAFNLLASYRSFPAGTIHVAVVDPGVGSARRSLAIQTAEQFFVGPDNGIFSWVCEREGKFRAVHLTNEKYFRQPVSATFHGRDVFAPVAGALSTGVPISEMGNDTDNLIQLESLTPRMVAPGVYEATIVHIDRFGNCITSLTLDQLSDRCHPKLVVNGIEIRSFQKFFAAANEQDDKPFCVLGSAGFLEIAIRNASAAKVLNVQSGQIVTLITEKANAC